MFKNYLRSQIIPGVEAQHNIMVFVGNGFDISILNKYRKDNLITSYSKFYDYLSFKWDTMKGNVLFEKMTSDKKSGKENWSDFEDSIGELLKENISCDQLNNSLKEMQDYFLLFLNELVEPQILLNENEDAKNNKWGRKSISYFLKDLCEDDLKKMKFPSRTYHHHMFDLLFVNFNYTSLLDNYLYLDKEQFEPHPHLNVATNFSFYPNPNGYDEVLRDHKTVWSTFVMMDIIHPHGYQNIPRSLLFGIEEKEYETSKEYKRFNKSYWAQNNQKYSEYFDDTQLFIIYGTSIGDSDRWWWEKIVKSLIETDSELIIYYYNDLDYDKNYVKDRFIKTCRNTEYQSKKVEMIKEKIYVVLYKDANDNMLFGLKNEEEVC